MHRTIVGQTSGVSRRALLHGIGAAGLGAAALPRRARAATPGVRVLEIFCFGGVFRWGSLRSPDLAFVAGEAPFDLSENVVDWRLVAGRDRYAPLNTGVVEYGPFALGPAAAPLLVEPASGAGALIDRTRLVALGHDLGAHEVAEPLVLTGDRPGRPTAAGLGALVNRLYDDGRCHSVVLDVADALIPRRSATLTGRMGLHYRPRLYPVPMAEFYRLLARDGLTGMDEVRAAMAADYGQRLLHPSLGERMRSKGMDAFDKAWDDLYHHEDLLGTVTLEQAESVSGTSRPYGDSRTAQAIRLGLELLCAGGDIHCVTILEGSDVQSYDTHTDSGNTQEGGLWSVLRALAMAHEEAPLDDVLVYIHSEFGRLDLDGEHTGTEHWAAGYQTLLVGGPIRSPACVGSLDTSSTGLPVAGEDTWSPTDLYGALLWAVQPEGAARDPFTEATTDGATPLLDEALQGTAAAGEARFGDAVERLFWGES